jgi:hypothetical protein
VVDATTVSSGLVELAVEAGVAKVKTPQVTCAGPNVLVQAVWVGTVKVPPR